MRPRPRPTERETFDFPMTSLSRDRRFPSSGPNEDITFLCDYYHLGAPRSGEITMVRDRLRGPARTPLLGDDSLIAMMAEQAAGVIAEEPSTSDDPRRGNGRYADDDHHLRSPRRNDNPSLSQSELRVCRWHATSSGNPGFVTSPNLSTVIRKITLHEICVILVRTRSRW